MQWSPETIADVAQAYRANHSLGRGDRQARLAQEQHFWAADAVTDAAGDGTLPLELIDALLHLEPHDEALESYVAADAIEDVMRKHPGRYVAAIAERCRRDPVWARAVGGVWLDRSTWDLIPDELRALMLEPEIPQQVQRVRTRRGRKAKRQSQRGRRR
ncbi:DUF6869 domain-containing protein [Georgenia phoenicis]|uniref:DUF6869 domain-containing protein n=1 Tax=unclassified Georgenia TaxID=2626815 RepID=UPI0039AF9FBE